MKTKPLLCMLLPALLFSHALQAGLPPEFSAEYSLHKFGMHAAQASSSLQQQADGSWLYQSQTKTKGVISIFRKDKITERTLLKKVANDFRPVSYQYIHKGGKKNRNRSVDFDWDKLQANSTISGKPSSVSIKAETVDYFSMQLRLMHDLQTAGKPQSYSIVKKGKLDDIIFKVRGTETIETDAGDFKAIKIERSRENSKRNTIMWLAPELHYLPVKIQHIETDGSKFSLLLDRVSGAITDKQASSD